MMLVECFLREEGLRLPVANVTRGRADQLRDFMTVLIFRASSCPTTWRRRPVSKSVASLPVLFGSSTVVLIISLLRFNSRCPTIGAFTPSQMRRELLFRVEHAPLD